MATASHSPQEGKRSGRILQSRWPEKSAVTLTRFLSLAAFQLEPPR